MKSMILGLALIVSTASLAQTNPQNCISIKNNLDRKYCMDKYLESVKTKLAAEKKAWGSSLTSDAKSSKSEALQTDIQGKKDHQAMLQSEIALYEKQLTDLNAMQVAAAKKKKKDKKKDKKKLPFGIKL